MFGAAIVDHPIEIALNQCRFPPGALVGRQIHDAILLELCADDLQFDRSNFVVVCAQIGDELIQ